MDVLVLTDEVIMRFEKHLRAEEKSDNTVGKYLRDVRAFAAYAAGSVITKETVMAYKTRLIEKDYAVSSINSMLAGINGLLSFLDRRDCTVKSIRVKKQACRPEELEMTRKEYDRLIEAAKRKGGNMLCLIMQTICGTGIRVSELRFISVEAVKNGRAVVYLKGGTRIVFIVRELKKKLLRYASEHGIKSGCIFVTRTGGHINRSNIWREMKKLCSAARINPSKVFPHNLRHLFARTFYGMERDIAGLADILGHSNINTTRIYIAATVKEYSRKMENMRLVI